MLAAPLLAIAMAQDEMLRENGISIVETVFEKFVRMPAHTGSLVCWVVRRRRLGNGDSWARGTLSVGHLRSVGWYLFAWRVQGCKYNCSFTL